MTIMLMEIEDSLILREALLNFSEITHMFLPIKEKRKASTAGSGPHWSLLLVSVIDGLAFHYDSLSPSNYNEATLATNKISQLLGKPLRFYNLDSPQQQNSSDSGIYVCVIMRYLLLKRLLSASVQNKVNMAMDMKIIYVSGARKEISRVINAFRKEAKKKKSCWSPSVSLRLILGGSLTNPYVLYFPGMTAIYESVSRFQQHSARLRVQDLK